MSKLLNLYNQLKSNNPDKIYFFQSGIFYIALQDDAKKLSELFNFKITNLSPHIIKIGFPISALEKYKTLFQNCSIKIEFINTQNLTYTISENKITNNTLSNISNNTNEHNTISLILDKIKNTDPNSLSVAEAYKFIDELKNLVKNGDDYIGTK